MTDGDRGRSSPRGIAARYRIPKRNCDRYIRTAVREVPRRTDSETVLRIFSTVTDLSPLIALGRELLLSRARERAN